MNPKSTSVIFPIAMGIGISIFLITSMLGGLLLLYAFGPQLDSLTFRGPYPCYPGIVMKAREKQVSSITATASKVQKVEFYLLVNDIPKRIGELTPNDLEELGFEPDKNDPNSWIFSETAGRTLMDTSYTFRDPSDRKNRYDKRIFNADYLLLYPSRLRFSNKPEGPFLTIPAKLDDVLKVFGKPERWVHPHRNGV